MRRFGVLASLVGPLVQAGISVFALSIYDADYLLVQEENLMAARQTWRLAGHHVAM
ncbi:MAG: ACT domain-containing protein [Chloroflexales bacterium]|nr:ACT domain-containing protein [Chloroflexales bacterium]